MSRPLKTGQIGALTGVRFVAAVWVVLFHIYLFNAEALTRDHPVAMAVLGPLVSQGDLGVDLFFMLSGFVLAHNYLARLGPRPSLPAIGRYLWLRLARIWPLYMVAVVGGGVLLALRESLWGSRPNVPLTASKLAQQAVMVQQWPEPNVPNSSWTGPAWSISAEWLAYLLFPLLAALVWRLRPHVSRTGLLLAAGLVMVPLLWWMAETRSQAQPYMWLGRLAAEFTCGLLLSAALAHGTPRLRLASTRLMPALLVVGVLWLYLAPPLAGPGRAALVLVLFPPLLVALAYGDGGVQRLLGSRPLVLGGGVSFALYLVHVPLIKLFRDLHANTEWVPLVFDQRAYGEVVMALISLGVAYLLFQYVEEPARRAMRDLGPSLGLGSADRPTRLTSLRLHPDAAVDANRLRVQVAVRHGLDHHRSQLVR